MFTMLLATSIMTCHIECPRPRNVEEYLQAQRCIQRCEEDDRSRELQEQQAREQRKQTRILEEQLRVQKEQELHNKWKGNSNDLYR